MYRILAPLFLLLAFAGGKAEAQTLKQTKEIVWSLYQSKDVAENPINNYPQARSLIENYLKSLDESVSHENIRQSYWETMMEAYEAKDDVKSLDNALLYLLTGGCEDLNVVYTAIAYVYANRENKAGLEWVLGMYREYSRSNDGKYDADIDNLAKEYDGVLNPVYMEGILDGRWVSIDIVEKRSKMGLPYTIFDFNGIDPQKSRLLGGGADLIYKLWNVDRRQRTMDYRFSNETLTHGNAELAGAAQNVGRQVMATTQAHVNNAPSSVSFESKLGATAASAAVASIFEGIGSSIARSHGRLEEHIVKMDYLTPQLMNGHVCHYTVTSNSSGQTREFKHADNDTRFVKWEESDSVMFVSSACKPIILASQAGKDSPVMRKYNEIKRKYTWTTPQNLSILIASEALGVGLLVNGIKNLANSNSEEDVKEGRAEKKSPIFSYIMQMMAGETIMILAPVLSMTIRDDKARKAYRQLNMEMYGRLRHKASSQLSLSPTYNSKTKAIGMGLTISY